MNLMTFVKSQLKWRLSCFIDRHLYRTNDAAGGDKTGNSLCLPWFGKSLPDYLPVALFISWAEGPDSWGPGMKNRLKDGKTSQLRVIIRKSSKEAIPIFPLFQVRRIVQTIQTTAFHREKTKWETERTKSREEEKREEERKERKSEGKEEWEMTHRSARHAEVND